MELFTLLLFKQKRYKLYMKQEKFFRLLPIEGAYNIRDLGGYPTSDHKHVKWKTFIRSGDLDKLTKSDLDYLTSLHIRTDIDFRSHAGKKSSGRQNSLNSYTIYSLIYRSRRHDRHGTLQPEQYTGNTSNRHTFISSKMLRILIRNSSGLFRKNGILLFYFTAQQEKTVPELPQPYYWEHWVSTGK